MVRRSGRHELCQRVGDGKTMPQRLCPSVFCIVLHVSLETILVFMIFSGGHGREDEPQETVPSTETASLWEMIFVSSTQWTSSSGGHNFMPRRCCIDGGRVCPQGDGGGIGLQRCDGLHRRSCAHKETVTPIIFMDKLVRSSVRRILLGVGVALDRRQVGEGV